MLWNSLGNPQASLEHILRTTVPKGYPNRACDGQGHSLHVEVRWLWRLSSLLVASAHAVGWRRACLPYLVPTGTEQQGQRPFDLGSKQEKTHGAISQVRERRGACHLEAGQGWEAKNPDWVSVPWLQARLLAGEGLERLSVEWDRPEKL